MHRLHSRCTYIYIIDRHVRRYRNLPASVLLFLLAAASASAQVLSAGTTLLRDDIPATIQQSHVRLAWPFAERFVSRTGYDYVFADQEEFNGLPRLRPALHRMTQSLEASIPEWNLHVLGEGSLSRVHTEHYFGDFRAAAAYRRTMMLQRRRLPLAMSLRVEGGRERDLSVSTAIMENIAPSYAEAEADVSLADRLQFVGHVNRKWYRDGNRIDNVYAYALLHAVHSPRVSLGYAYAWSDSEFSTWSMTGSSFDPRRREFSYEYFYSPYFSPLQERGHLFIGILQWMITPSLLVHGKASIPFWSRGQLKYMPATGRTPLPIDYGVRYELDDILPTQYDAGLYVGISRAISVDLSIAYFSKPYYEYFAGGLTLLYQLFPYKR